MILAASTVTVVPVPDAGAVSVKAGFVNVRGCQSFRKKPMLFAMTGSTGVTMGGTTTGGCTTGGGGAGEGVFSEQEDPMLPTTSSAIAKEHNLREYMSDVNCDEC